MFYMPQWTLGYKYQPLLLWKCLQLALFRITNMNLATYYNLTIYKINIFTCVSKYN